MSDPTIRDVLARVAAQQAELAAQRAMIVALQARVAARERTHRRKRRASPLFPALLVALLVGLTPLTLLAANPFTDLNSGSVHNPNIDAIYNAGVTTGCVPNEEYCPNATVTREEMASFLARLGGLGTNPPVANARTLQGYTPSGLARVARVEVPNNYFATPPQEPTDVSAVHPAFQTVATIPITAPTAGFVLVVGSTFSATVAGEGIFVRLRDAAGTTASPLVGHVAGDLIETTLAPLYVFPVGAGDRAFVLEAAKGTPGPAGEAVLFDTTLVALFVPFGPTGGSTLAAP